MGKGATVVLHGLSGSSMYPVWVFSSYAGLRETGTGPLLMHTDGSFLCSYKYV